MKLALGMIVRNEAWILERTLPTITPYFHHKIAIDYLSTDNSKDILMKHGFTVVKMPWRYNYAEGRNNLINIMESVSTDAVVMLDADESIDFRAIPRIRQLLETYDNITLPRIEFVKDFQHYDPSCAPDYQNRVFRLNKGYHFVSKIHECLVDKDERIFIYQDKKISAIEDRISIYHYGKCKPLEMQELKFWNYDRIYAGEMPLKKLPEGHVIRDCFWKQCEPYNFDHPLKHL